MMLRFFVYVLCLVTPALALALHGSWQDHYTDEHGSRCCGVADCLRVRIQVVTTTENAPPESKMTLILNEEVVIQLAPSAVHISEDTHAWWCARNATYPPSTENTRCVFLAVGS